MNATRWLLLGVVCVLFGPAAPLAAQVRVTGEAISGQPFGVARVTIPVPGGEAGRALETNSFVLTENQQRVHHPVFSEGQLRRVLSNLLGNRQPPSSVTVYFLFRGDDPLDLTFRSPSANRFRLVPRRGGPRAHERLLTQWWRQYHAMTREQAEMSDYPQLVESYLTTMLARRLRLEPPLLSRIQEQASTETEQTFELLLGAERLKMRTLRETVLRTAPSPVADRPVPAAPAWPRLQPQAAGDVPIEPMAMHVPEECFYIRFGKFSNYLWVDNLMGDYGGQLSSMVTLRGYHAPIGNRIQKQLALKKNALADLLGDTVIADVALIGHDLYLQEGAALGMLFQAHDNNGLLGADFKDQRQEALKEEKANGATIQPLEIAGRPVTLLSTPDNRIRSYYAVDGKFHLVSTSRRLVERFFEAGQGGRPLGTAAEFRHARTIMPTKRKDSVFVYFSAVFLQSLLSPQYQIELHRRLQAVTDLELLQMAQAAAKAEGLAHESIDDLVAGDFLPPGFGLRPDGSRLVIQPDGGIVDSLRGGRTSFVPIPDISIEAVTEEEAARYQQLAGHYLNNWKQLDPLMIGVQRWALDRKGRERVTLDAYVAPLDEFKYQWLLSMLGPPTRRQVTTAPGNIVTAQAAIRGGLLSADIPPHILFLGIQDNFPVRGLSPKNLLETLQLLKSTPGYLGAWPKPGFLDMLPFGLGGGQPDAAGYSALLFGLWRRQGGGFSTLSFQRPVLAHVTPHLRVVDAENAVHARAQVGDLSQSAFGAWVNGTSYGRARTASLGNVRFLHLLTQQLKIPREQAMDEARRLLDAELACTLGGNYHLLEEPGKLPAWTSSELLKSTADRVPDTYQAPILEWFRGLDAEATKLSDRLVLHATLDMQRKPKNVKLDLPLFNLDLFNFGKPKEKKSDEPEELPPAQPDPPRNKQKRPTARDFE